MPIVFYVVRTLPDRGYSIARPIALLLLFYPLWLISSTGIESPALPIFSNNLLTIWLIILIVLIGSFFLFIRQKNEIILFVRKEFTTLIAIEGVFLAVFIFWMFIRLNDPSISHTEQPMDFAFLNASAISNHFPPNDPWLSGETINYYYFGYLIFGCFSKIAGVSLEIGYNLALITVAAMAAAAIFGISSNLVRVYGGTLRSSLLTGLLSVILLLGIGNLVSGLELIRAGGGGTESFWDWIDVKDLDDAKLSSTWHPSESGWWWWRATRVIDTTEDGQSLDYTITEFPFFSFTLGDLHPHVMSLPFFLVAATLIFNFMLSPNKVGKVWGFPKGSSLLALTALSLSMGALGFINFIDLVTLWFIFTAVTFVKTYGGTVGFGSSLLSSLKLAGPIILLSVVAYLPFYFSFPSQAHGISTVDNYVTRPFHFFLIWGLFIFMMTPYLLVESKLIIPLWRKFKQRMNLALSVAVTLVPFAVWSGFQLILFWNQENLASTISARALHILPLASVLLLATYLALTNWQLVSMQKNAIPNKAPVAFTMILMATGFLLLMGIELFQISDHFNNRMNTVFKFSYQTWCLFSIAAAFSVYRLISRYNNLTGLINLPAYFWLGTVTLLLITSMYYPLSVTYMKLAESIKPVSLDGLQHVASSNPDEHATIQWLKNNATWNDTILEAVGDDYSEFSRISSSSGIPTVLGWVFHETQWRNTSSMLDTRKNDVRSMYETKDTMEAKELLDKYQVTYIIVGPRELSKYGHDGPSKFDSISEQVYPESEGNGSYSIYRVNR
ncbi:MAG: putative membrane protein [Chloroflexi bacterium]|jgi:YYY domain-containing protein|nr:MAG: putative membrane protein [Chloroflexota bacterium]